MIEINSREIDYSNNNILQETSVLGISLNSNIWPSKSKFYWRLPK